MITKIKPYLQLSRIHSSPLETVPAYIGAALASNSVFSIDIFLWIIAGVLYHVIGYSMNSYEDWKAGYDQDDPHKQHHPLNTGVLSPDTAKRFTYTLFILGTLYTVYIIPNVEGYAVFILAVLFGVLYNTIGKKTSFKFILISIAHTAMFVLPYVSLGGDIVLAEFIFGVIFMFLSVMFQISLSGNIKDIKIDEESFLQFLGASTSNNHVSFGNTVRIYSYTLKILTIILAILVTLMHQNITATGIIISLSIGVYFSTYRLVSDGYFNRGQRLTDMSLIEGLTVSILVFMYSHVLGITIAVAIVLSSSMYVFVLNRYLWGTHLSPAV